MLRKNRAIKFEALERRQMLSASAIAFNAKSGLLTVTGTNYDDNIQLSGDGTPGDVAVSVTTPSGTFTATLTGVKNVKIDSKNAGSGDEVVVTDLIIPGDLTIKTGNGSDLVEVIDNGFTTQIGGKVSIDTDKGNDAVGVGYDFVGGTITGPVQICKDLSIETEKGDDAVVVAGLNTVPDEIAGIVKAASVKTHLTPAQVADVSNFSQIGGKVSIETGDGNDAVGVLNTLIGGKLSIETGDGLDAVGVSFVLAQKSASIKTGSSDDAVGVMGLAVGQVSGTLTNPTGFTGGDFNLETGGGCDGVAVTNDPATLENALLAFIAAHDTVLSTDLQDLLTQVANDLGALPAPPISLAAKNATIKTGDGADYATIDSVYVTNKLSVDMGGGCDSLYFYATNYFGTGNLDGGGSKDSIYVESLVPPYGPNGKFTYNGSPLKIQDFEYFAV
jgi:hypothetical protein